VPFPPLRLAPNDERRLVELCRRALPLHPIAFGEFVERRRRVESTWLRSLQFSSEGAAQAWNEGWERVATDRHFTYPVLLSMNGAPIGDPAIAFVARIASRVMHEEIRGGTPVPGVSAGWQVELALSHAYETMPAPWMSDSLVFTASWSVLDASGEALWCVDCAREYDARHLPPNAPHLLTAKPRFETLEAMSAE